MLDIGMTFEYILYNIYGEYNDHKANYEKKKKKR